VKRGSGVHLAILKKKDD